MINIYALFYLINLTIWIKKIKINVRTFLQNTMKWSDYDNFGYNLFGLLGTTVKRNITTPGVCRTSHFSAIKQKMNI